MNKLVVSLLTLFLVACGGGGGSPAAVADAPAASQLQARTWVQKWAGNEPYYESCAPGATTLVVWLHTWSGTYQQIAEHPQMLGVNACVVAPNMNGANGLDSRTCGSPDAIARAVRVVNQAKAEHNTTRTVLMGVSGGAYMSLMLVGTNSHLFDKALIWEPLYDLAAWHAEYPANNLVGCLGAPPSDPNDPAYLARSPRGVLDGASVPDMIVAGGLLDVTTPIHHARQATAHIRTACPTCRVDHREYNMTHGYQTDLVMSALAELMAR